MHRLTVIWRDVGHPVKAFLVDPVPARGADAAFRDLMRQLRARAPFPETVTLQVAFRVETRGRALGRRWRGFHRRSRVETKMHCVKLLGQRLMARDFDRQVAELQNPIAVLNGYTGLGISVTKAVG